MHGGEVGANGAEGIGALPGSEAAGYFLFDLGHAYGLLGKIVGERDIVVGSETPDIVGAGAQAREEVCRLALRCSPTFSGSRSQRVGGPILTT